VDATRALVDELANSTTARDGKEEMMRCEEIFRQICWLEERFWPDVDGMGEEDESAQLSNNGMGSMSGNVGGMGNNMNDSGMNGTNMNGSNMNGSGMSSSGMNGPGMSGPNMGSQGMGGSNMNAPNMNGGDGTPVSDGRNSFGGLDGVGQTS
jgi:hypothetical protein